MTTPTTPTLVAKLQERLVQLGDVRDPRLDWTAYNATQRAISALLNVPGDLAAAQAQLADTEAQRAVVIAKQQEIEQEIATTEGLDPSSIRDAHARHKAIAHRDHLLQQLQHLHNGTLLSGPGTTYGHISGFDQRIKELTERRDRLQRECDSHMCAAEALLGAVPVTS